MRFDLHASGLLIAASQAIRRLQKGAKANGHERVWKPLDFGFLRLYEVRLWWNLKKEEVRSRSGGTERHIVASTAPSAAAGLIKKVYAESYNNNPHIADWGVVGRALNVYQPLSWTENGIDFLRSQVQICTWTREPGVDYGVWDTGCGKVHRFAEGGPEDTQPFCGYCGGTIEVKALDPAASVT